MIKLLKKGIPWVLLSLCTTAVAEEMAVDRYMDLTMERLHLILEVGKRDRRSPTTDELDALMSKYGTTRPGYLSYASRQRRAIEGYLDLHPALRDEIDSLSAAIVEVRK